MNMYTVLFFFILIPISLSIIYYTIKNGISPMPSSKKALERLLEASPQNPKGKILDLGCGWGTLIFPLADEYPESQVIGYENSPIPFLFCKARQFFHHSPNLTIRFKDFHSIQFEDSSFIICYLYPGAMRSLKPKLEKELPNGAFVISNTFAIPGWTPEKTYVINDIYKTKVYRYQIDRSRLTT